MLLALGGILGFSLSREPADLADDCSDQHQHRSETQAEDEHVQQAEHELAAGERRQQHGQRGRVRQQAAGEPQAEQQAPAVVMMMVVLVSLRSVRLTPLPNEHPEADHQQRRGQRDVTLRALAEHARAERGDDREDDDAAGVGSG